MGGDVLGAACARCAAVRLWAVSCNTLRLTVYVRLHELLRSHIMAIFLVLQWPRLATQCCYPSVHVFLRACRLAVAARHRLALLPQLLLATRLLVLQKQ